MTIKKGGLFLKILISLFILTVLVVLIGRNHLLPGTALIMFRWVFLIVGLILLWVSIRRAFPRYFNIGLIGVLCPLLVEFGWSKFNEKALAGSQSVTTEVSLMTYNIFFRNYALSASLVNIQKADPGILALQELTPGIEAKLEDLIGRQYPYRKTLPLEGTNGIGLYSKYPIVTSEYFWYNERPIAQLAILEINGKKVQVINVHLASPARAVEDPENFLSLYIFNYWIRQEQWRLLSEAVDKSKGDCSLQLLMGDLNTTRHEPIFRNIKTDWVDLHAEAGNGWGLNFPHSEKLDPLFTLDYIFARGELEALDLRVVEGGGSDHLAIVGKIKI